MPDLPTGTVTFLFTDVESSTKLLQAHPEAYRAAVRRHHDLLQEAVETHGGVVFETVGDAVYAAFHRPTDAVAAALAGQLALHQEPWADGVAITVRMGLHTGEVERQGDHYFGAPLYRCARLMSTAHGGQVVLSEVVGAAVRDALPDGVTLRDLGEHRLKDLTRPGGRTRSLPTWPSKCRRWLTSTMSGERCGELRCWAASPELRRSLPWPASASSRTRSRWPKAGVFGGCWTGAPSARRKPRNPRQTCSRRRKRDAQPPA